MKKIMYLSLAAAFAFATVACNSNNTTTEQEAQNEPAVEETVAAEPVAPETFDHYEWTMTLPTDIWEVNVAYSDMGVDKIGEDIHFNIKDWKDTSIEKCAPNGGCLEENRQEDIVTGNYTWTVYTKAGNYGVACYTYDPSNKMVVRVGAEGIDDPKSSDLMAILEGFAVKE